MTSSLKQASKSEWEESHVSSRTTQSCRLTDYRDALLQSLESQKDALNAAAIFCDIRDLFIGKVAHHIMEKPILRDG